MIGLCIAGNTAEEVEEAPQFGFDGLPVFRTSAIIDWGWNCFATGGNKDSQSAVMHIRFMGTCKF